MNKYRATILIVTLQYGSSALISPGIISLLGPVQFSMLLFSIISFYFFCGFLSHDTYLYVLRKNCSRIEEFSRWPMKRFSYEAYGHCFGEFSIYLLSIIILMSSGGMLILAAQTIQVSLPIDSISFFNQIRLWTFILILLLILPSFYGTYNELGMLTYVCFACICVYEICAISASILIYLNKDSFNAVEKIDLPTDKQSSYEILISSIGEITFTTSGCSLVLPNLAVTITNTEDLRFPIVASYFIVFWLYFASGMIPFQLLQDYQIESSLLNTLVRIAANQTTITYSTEILKILIVFAQIGVAGHLVLAFILFVNPVFLFCEEKFKVPKDFGWKRAVTRCTIMFAICLFCILVPEFPPLISFVGGIPIMCQCLFIPFLIYFKLFSSHISFKIFCVILFVVLFILMLNINFVNLYILIETNTF